MDTLNDPGLHGLKLIPTDEELSQTRNTRSVAHDTPGVVNPDGSFIDAYGFKHYPYGAKYRYSETDRRLTAHGAYQTDRRGGRISDNSEDMTTADRLHPRDLQTVLLYLRGLSRRDIAKIMGISEQTVTTRLNRPEVQAYISEQKSQWTTDLHALTEAAIEVLRDSMSPSEEMKYRLAGAEKVLRTNERLGSSKPTAKEDTATTHLQQVLAAIRGENVTVNING